MLPLLICGSIVFAVVLIVSAIRNHNFKKRFPPISDEEFLSRCTPGTNPDVALKVRRIIAKHFSVAYERVYPSTTFVEDLLGD